MKLLRADEQAPAVALALAICARISAVRPVTPRALEAQRAWVRAGGTDPLASQHGPDAWRAWLDGRELPEGLVHALLLATAGAPRACVEQARRVVEHLVEARFVGKIADESRSRAGVCEPAAGLLRWLGRDAAGRDDLPAAATNPGWTSTAARVLAEAAVRREGPRAALSFVAARCIDGGFECALAAAVVRCCVLDARSGPGECSAALGATAEDFALALHGASLSHAASLPAPDYAALVRALLGRDLDAQAHAHSHSHEGSPLASPAWLTAHARAELVRAALANPALAACDFALTLLERTGTAPALVSPLRALALGAPDAMTRARARALAAAPPGVPLSPLPAAGALAARLTRKTPQVHRS